MLLSNRRSGLKFFSSGAFLSLCAIFFLNYRIWSSNKSDDWDWSSTSTAAVTTTSHLPKQSWTSESFSSPKSISIETSIPAPTKSSQSESLLSATPVVQPTSIPSEPSVASIPEKIWYKLGPKGLSKEMQQWTDTCITKNPTFEHEFMTDAAADLWVQEKFSHRPDIVEAYLTLTVPILKADLFRYLILFAEGGVWSDLDVSCRNTPIRDWIPGEYKDSTNILVGVEWDVGLGYPFERQFTTWIVMAKPGSAHLMVAVEDILVSLQDVTEKHNIGLGDLKIDMVGDVIEFSGPLRLARSVNKSLESQLGQNMHSDNYTMLYEPKLIGDVLILPGYAFASTVNTYEENKGGTALVQHHYSGSWKNDYGGEQVLANG